ncbi:MAG: hypothetical protein QOJ98_1366 [Acidobacteriota bacterium]|jgi:hypothetical protein|nr:hypothetical protein [Acidobacteriota bacterium]
MSWFRGGAGLRRTGRIGSAQRDELEIPDVVLREGLANALVHRDYETPLFMDQPTRLEVFPDRVEITSFGSLVAPFLAEQLNSDTDDRKPWRRNPLIAEIFQYMGHVELNASGVSRMRREMEKASLAFPRFSADADQGIVRVVLARPLDFSDEDEIPPPSAPRPGQLVAMISGTVADLPEHRKLAVDVCTRRKVFRRAEFINDLRASHTIVESGEPPLRFVP